MRKRALFLPSCGGKGFGHLNRCLVLAQEMEKQGWVTAAALTQDKANLLRRKDITVIEMHHLIYPGRSSGTPPAYTFIPDGNMQVIRDGFTSPWRVWWSLRELMQAIGKLKPDVLIGDLNLLAWIAGKRLGIPVVQIIQAIIHPKNPKLLWWDDKFPASASFQSAIAFMGNSKSS